MKIKINGFIKVIVIVMGIISICLFLGQIDKRFYNIKQKYNDRYKAIDSTKLILVTQNDLMYSKHKDSRAVLIIKNRDEINNITKLYKGNRSLGHACSYHWSISFMESPTKGIQESFNEECEKYLFNTEEIHNILAPYFAKIKESPTEFLINIEIPSSFNPEEAINNLQDEGYLFLLQGNESRSSYIKVGYTNTCKIPEDRKEWTSAESQNKDLAIEKVIGLINSLKVKYTIVNNTSPNVYNSTFGGGKIEDTAETTIYFSNSDELNKVESDLQGFEILEKYVANTYTIQLISSINYSKTLKEQLMSKYSFIIDVH